MSRRTWTYTLGGRALPEPLEVTSGAEPEGFNAGEERAPLFTDRYMDGDRAPDGSDIGSRQKRRAYMQAHGVVDTSDYRETWARKQQQRADWLTGRAPVSREALDDVGRAAHEAARRKR